jgi:hypothetical protein
MSQYWPGGLTSASVCTSGRSAHDIDILVSPSGTSSSSWFAPANVGGNSGSRLQDEAERANENASKACNLSLGQLRSIVLGSLSQEKSSPSRRTGASVSPIKTQTHSQSGQSKLAATDSGFLPARGSRQHATGNTAASKRASGHANGRRNRTTKRTASDLARCKARAAEAAAQELPASTQEKDLPSRELSSEAPGSAASGLSEFNADLDVEVANDFHADDDDEDDGDDEEVQEAESNAEAAMGKARQKKGKPHGHFNPFVEFEDREQRLMWERRWLKDDDAYMRERMKGMRLDSVQARLSKGEIAGEHLYEDALYFGPYSCGMRMRHQKQSHLRTLPDTLPPVQRSAASAAIENMEAEHHAKSKKGHVDKAIPTKEVICVRSMKAVLEESGRVIESHLG